MKNYNEDLINQLIKDYQPRDILKKGVSDVIKYYCEVLAKKKDEEFISYLQAIKESPLEKVNALIEESLSRYMMKQDTDRGIQTDRPFTICIDGHTVEFKSENENKPNGDIYFTYKEAIKRFKKPDKDGWRLPTKGELKVLCNYSYKFDAVNGQGIFDNRLYLPAAGYRYCNNVNNVGSDGFYWSSTPDGSDEAWHFCLYSDEVRIGGDSRRCGFSVRLVRELK